MRILCVCLGFVRAFIHVYVGNRVVMSADLRRSSRQQREIMQRQPVCRLSEKCNLVFSLFVANEKKESGSSVCVILT